MVRVSLRLILTLSLTLTLTLTVILTLTLNSDYTTLLVISWNNWFHNFTVTYTLLPWNVWSEWMLLDGCRFYERFRLISSTCECCRSSTFTVALANVPTSTSWASTATSCTKISTFTARKWRFSSTILSSSRSRRPVGDHHGTCQAGLQWANTSPDRAVPSCQFLRSSEISISSPK